MAVMRTIVKLAGAVVLAAAMGTVGAADAARAQHAPAELAPECVTVVVLSAQTGGGTVRLHLEFCGSGPGADSALHDYVNHNRFILDGGGLPGVDCGGWADPCVIFPQ